MTIKSIINNWYKELFWIGVGSVITLAAEKVVRTIKENRQEKETEEAFETMLHNLEELRNANRGEKEPELEVEPCEETGDCHSQPEATDIVDGRVEPVPEGAKLISQEDFEDLRVGPEVNNRFELVYSHEENLFGYDDSFHECVLEDDMDIRTMLKKNNLVEWVIRTLMNEQINNIYLSINDGDVYICVRSGSVEEVK